MTFVETTPEDEADGALAEVYAAAREQMGYVPNYTKAFSSKPEVFQAWDGLNGAIKHGMDERRYELATLAAARRLRSSYCMLAHGKLTARKFLGEDAVRELAGGARPDDAADAAVIELAEKVVDDAASIGPEDVQQLRNAGLPDEEIVGVVLAAAARCFFSKTLDALSAEPDAAFLELDPAFRDALVVGRPIAEA